MQKLVTVLVVVFLASICIAAQDENSVAEDAAGKKNVAKSIVASKAIGVEQIKAIDHVGANRYALVIGINDYQDGLIPDLKNCQTDAQALYDLLTDPAKGGIDKKNANLLLGKQATSRNIRIHLGKLRRIPLKSTVFIYFSGHGSKEGDEAYWVAQDSRMEDLFATGISNMEVQRYLSSIPSDRVVIMLDCCYAAATVKGGKASVGDFADVLNKFTGKGRAYLMAAGSGEEAIEAKDLKHSVFSHYLIEGMAGQADDNKDGVIVLTELSTYVDKNVADEARIRGGIQRPVVRMDNVTEPSKFRLTIDAERIARSIRETAETKELRKARQAKLRQLALDDKITAGQHYEGRKLLTSDFSALSETDRQKLAEYVRVINGKLPPSRLTKALSLIETPEERKVRLEHEAAERADRKRKDKFASLMAQTQAKDNKEGGKEALKFLEEALQLYPDSVQAKQMKDRIEQEVKEHTERERQEKFSLLMAQARAMDNKENGKDALKLIEEALQLYPGSTEALQLSEKISGYYWLEDPIWWLEKASFSFSNANCDCSDFYGLYYPVLEALKGTNNVAITQKVSDQVKKLSCDDKWAIY